jgi:hypothetical protein
MLSVRIQFVANLPYMLTVHSSYAKTLLLYAPQFKIKNSRFLYVQRNSPTQYTYPLGLVCVKTR